MRTSYSSSQLFSITIYRRGLARFGRVLYFEELHTVANRHLSNGMCDTHGDDTTPYDALRHLTPYHGTGGGGSAASVRAVAFGP